MMAYSGSKYLAESAFSDMNIIKSENRNSLINEHLAQCLRLDVSSYNPEFEKLLSQRNVKDLINYIYH